MIPENSLLAWNKKILKLDKTSFFEDLSRKYCTTESQFVHNMIRSNRRRNQNAQNSSTVHVWKFMCNKSVSLNPNDNIALCRRRKTKSIRFFSTLTRLGSCQIDIQGPVFSQEPPHRVEFSNNTGGHVECSGHGSPQPEVRFRRRSNFRAI